MKGIARKKVKRKTVNTSKRHKKWADASNYIIFTSKNENLMSSMVEKSMQLQKLQHGYVHVKLYSQKITLWQSLKYAKK